VVNLTPWLLYALERTLVPTGEEAGWAPEPVQMLLRTEKNLTPAEIQTYRLWGYLYSLLVEAIKDHSNNPKILYAMYSTTLSTTMRPYWSS